MSETGDVINILLLSTCRNYKLFVYNYNSNNNNHICVVPYSRDFLLTTCLFENLKK